MRAWVVMAFVVVVGCGDDKSGGLSSPDGGDPDLVLVAGIAPGHNVTFVDSDGVLLADVPADADGRAQADMPAGGSVVSLTVTDGSCSGLITTGVKPGDHLAFALPPARDNPATMTAWFIPVPDADTRVYTPCGTTDVPSTQPGATLPFFDDCHGSSFELLMVATGGALAVPVFTSMVGVTYKDDGAFQLTGEQTAMQAFTATLHGIRAQEGDISVTRSAVLDGAEFGPSTGSISPSSSTESVVFPYEQGFGVSSVVVASWPGHDVAVLKPTVATGIDIDLDAMRLPSVTAVTWIGNGLSWATDGVGNTPDAVSVTWHGEYIADRGQEFLLGYQMLGPWSDHLSVPPLPMQYAQCDPNQQSGLFEPLVVGFQFVAVDYDQIEGYDEFRQQPADLFDPLGTIRRFAGLEIHRRSIGAGVARQPP